MVLSDDKSNVIGQKLLKVSFEPIRANKQQRTYTSRQTTVLFLYLFTKFFVLELKLADRTFTAENNCHIDTNLN